MSSFLEDFLKKEVDQNQVNALVGSLENQLTTSRSSPVAVPGSLNATPGKNTINSNQHYVNVTSNLRAGTPENSLKNSPVNSIRNKIVASIVHTVANGSIEGRKLLTVASNGIDGAKSASPGPISGSSGSPRMANINNTIQVSIAPKVSNTVPIAPRLGSNIMISPRHAQQIFMAQQRFSQNALFQNAFITRVPGGIPVVPRMPGAIAVPSIINAQIPNVRTVGQARQQGIINMVPRSNGPTRVRVNSPLSAASLTQIKTTTNAIPGQVNYRFRQVNPASVNQNNGVSSSPAAANLTVMKESVKRLKEFFQNLINLACGPNQPPEIGRIVKELVHNLMQSRISEEEFIDKLQKTLKSDPQPNLVHFLKKTLPHLRETIKKQQIHQTNSKNVQQISKANSVHHNIRGIAPSILVGDSHKAFAGQGRIIVASSGQVTPGMKTRLQAPHHGMAGKVFVKPNGTLSDAAMGNSMTGADEEYIDVTSMDGVNLMGDKIPPEKAYRFNEIATFVPDVENDIPEKNNKCEMNFDSNKKDKHDIVMCQHYLLKKDIKTKEHVFVAGTICKESYPHPIESNTVRVYDSETKTDFISPTDHLYLLTRDQTTLLRTIRKPKKRLEIVLKKSGFMEKVLALNENETITFFNKEKKLAQGKFHCWERVNSEMYLKILVEGAEKLVCFDKVTFNKEIEKTIPEDVDKKLTTNGGINVGSKVVVPIKNKFKDEIEYKHGKVKLLHQEPNFEILCGVETDDHISVSLGNYFNNKKIFDCKFGHGIIVDINEVIPIEAYHPNEDKKMNTLNVATATSTNSFYSTVNKPKDNVHSENIEMKANVQITQQSSENRIDYLRYSKPSNINASQVRDNIPTKENRVDISDSTNTLPQTKNIQNNSSQNINPENADAHSSQNNYFDQGIDAIIGNQPKNNDFNFNDSNLFGEQSHKSPTQHNELPKVSNMENASHHQAIGAQNNLNIVIEHQPYITDVEQLIGKWHGIQGHSNSCYMDATLFAMFACSDVFDSALYNAKVSHQSDRYNKVREVLKSRIINPLRKNKYISEKNIQELRHHLDAANKSKHMSDKQDVEEFVNLLFDKILGFPPFINIWSEKNKSTFSTHLLKIFVSDYESQPLPSIQYLLDKSFLEEEMYLEKVPDTMILLLPRNGKEKIFTKADSTIDLSCVLKARQWCMICQNPAEFYCFQCSSLFGKENLFPFMCISCLNVSHTHPSRKHHSRASVRRIPPPNTFDNVQQQQQQENQNKMELFAVLCMKLSHHVAFVRCNDSWVLFDSMADRDEENSFPCISEVKDLGFFLDAPALAITNLKDTKMLEQTARLFEDAYMWFYRPMKKSGAQLDYPGPTLDPGPTLKPGPKLDPL